MIITLSEEEIRALISNALQQHQVRDRDIEFEFDGSPEITHRGRSVKSRHNQIERPILARIDLRPVELRPVIGPRSFESQPAIAASPSTISITSADLELAATLELDQLAKKFMTDKFSGSHFYTRYYEQILKDRKDTIQSVLEIGIGGGGSLKMWAAYFPNAIVYGIDVNERKSDSERIQTFQINQSDKEKLTKAFSDKSFDLIVDDGGHSGSAIMDSLEVLFNYLSRDGYYAIEDMTVRNFDTAIRTSLKEYCEAFRSWKDSFSQTVLSWVIENHGKVKSFQMFPDKGAQAKMCGQTLIFIQKA